MPSHSIHTALEDSLVDSVIGYMLPTHANMVGKSFEPDLIKNSR
jgi:hypothetical protein